MNLAVLESSSHLSYKCYHWGINNDDAINNVCAMERRASDQIINNWLEIFVLQVWSDKLIY